MKNFFIPALATCLIVTAVFTSCNKINLPTELGLDMIPPIDNIHTFDTTLEVDTYNGVFDPVLDSFRMLYSYPHFLGLINDDPIFGKTDARIFFQVSSGGYPFKNRPESLYLDSVVLVLKYQPKLTYGDTLLSQTIRVSEIDPSSEFRSDTAYQLNKLFSTTDILGSATIIPASLKDSFSVINYPDTTKVANQIRIRLNNSFGERLLSYDSTGISNYDSVFRTKFKGFALESVAGGNALMGFDLTSSELQLAVYYRYNNATTASDIDTAVASYTFYNGANASANYIHRDYTGTDVLSGSGDWVPDPVVYIQNSPGTYSYIKIPGLEKLPNSVVHLAELQMESIYDVSDTLFYPSTNLFVDVYDSTESKFKLVPHVLGYSGTAGTLANYSGFYSGRPTSWFYKQDPASNQVRQWRFNLTRYAQRILSNHEKSYLMRLYAPAYVALPLGDPTPIVKDKYPIPQSDYIGFAGVGRVRLGGGNHATQKMKLRVVYSKL